MATQSEDLLKTYADNESHIKHLRESIEAKAEKLSKLGKILESDPEVLSKPGILNVTKGGDFFIDGPIPVSCGLLKELAQDILNLSDLRLRQLEKKNG